MNRFSRKESFLISNTLSCVPVLMHGKSVLIDLRNDSRVAGRIDYADGYMNISLNEVVFFDNVGGMHLFDNFTVTPRMIRSIQLPDDYPIMDDIREWCKNGCLNRSASAAAAANKMAKSKKLTFKQKRAEVRHKATLKEIAKQKQKQQQQQQQKKYKKVSKFPSFSEVLEVKRSVKK